MAAPRARASEGRGGVRVCLSSSLAARAGARLGFAREGGYRERTGVLASERTGVPAGVPRQTGGRLPLGVAAGDKKPGRHTDPKPHTGARQGGCLEWETGTCAHKTRTRQHRQADVQGNRGQGRGPSMHPPRQGKQVVTQAAACRPAEMGDRARRAGGGPPVLALPHCDKQGREERRLLLLSHREEWCSHIATQRLLPLTAPAKLSLWPR